MNRSSPISLVVLISGSGTNLQAIIDEIAKGNLNARIAAVISNEPEAYGLKRAAQAGIPYEVINHRDFPTRQAFDQQLTASIESCQPDLVILAGFMRILTDQLVNHFEHRMLNIHPSLLPDYKGLHTHQRVLDDQQPRHGCSVHFVTPKLDDGPVIVQAVIDIEADDNANSLQQRVQQQEYIIYPMAIRMIAEGRVTISADQVHIDNKIRQQPLQVKAVSTK